MNLLQKFFVVAACGATLMASFVAFIYAQPGKTMKIKWRRSYRKLRRYSKELMRTSNTSLVPWVPVMQSFINVAQFVMERLPQ